MRSYQQFLSDLKSNRITAKKEVETFLANIEVKKNLNAFLQLDTDSALAKAEESDRRFKEGNPRRLEGLVVGVKDNISVKGMKMTCASKMLEEFEPLYDATVVKRLSEEGAIVIGKINMDEFAMGSSNETSFFGNVINPYGENLVPGGSSGGSAVAVAADMCHIALGSDTGGSVRQPAAFCGTFGYKPSYGNYSRYGLVSFASSLDCIGVIAACGTDLLKVNEVIRGRDENDATTTDLKSELNEPNELKTIGVLADEDIKRASTLITDEYYRCIESLKASGYDIKTISLSKSDTWIPTYYLISTSEASSNLSRYDGVAYGYRAKEFTDITDMVTKTRSQGFGDEVKKRIMLGTYSLSSGYYDAFFKKAQKSRRLIAEDYERVFEEVDLIFLPTTPTVPFGIGQKINDPIAMYLSDFYTASANLAGIPAINVPIGLTENGVPIGMQIQSKVGDDDFLLKVADDFAGICTNSTVSL
jgi:aspartyl-tRNA(Asn)/glutamyl-tRNA(Gln) amidotransferase subunit A